MDLPVNSENLKSDKLKKGLTVVGLFFVIVGVGIGGYYLGLRTAVSQFQELQEEVSSVEEPSYLKNPFSSEETSEGSNPFYQNPFRTIKGLYTEKSE